VPRDNARILNRLLREPLLHFLAIGAALFAVYAFVGRNAATPSRIVVTAGRIESLAAGFERTWRRPPTPEELDGLVRDYVLEEACAREAIARGLDQDDGVIRRRLQQKLLFITDVEDAGEPTEAQLAAFLAAHPERFRSEDRISFRHVYFSPEHRGARARSDAEAALSRLAGAKNAAAADAEGDPFLLDHAFDALPVGEIAMRFGDAFAAEVAKLPPGSWQGPIRSSYGLHLVFVDARREGTAPSLAGAHDQIERAWREEARVASQLRFREEILKRYQVTIESAGAPPTGAVAGGAR